MAEVTSQIAGKSENLNRMSIGFDAKRAFFNKSGLGNYSRNLLNALVKTGPGNAYYLFTPKTKNRIILENDDRYNIIGPQTIAGKTFGSLWRRRLMVKDIARNGIQVFHGLSHELPVGIERSGAKSIVTVHDLIFMSHPHYYKWIDTNLYTAKLKHACRVADRIVAISRRTADDLVSLLDVSPEKITVIYQGCHPSFWNSYSPEFTNEVRAKYSLPERYLLYVGTVEERKNLFGLIRALHRARTGIPLVVVGRKAEPYFKRILGYISENGIKDIIFPGFVTNADLPLLYRNAECFIYPSFVEGFGIPLVEALVSGTPVITSVGGCFSEAAGPGSLYVDPHDPDSLAEAILRVTCSRELREQMAASGKEYAEIFREETIGRANLELYRAIL